MQRLFSIFPNSWPGCGLLILRILLCAFAVGESSNALLVCGVFRILARLTIFSLGGLTLIGLWTPLAALMFMLIECCEMVLFSWEVHGARALVALSLAMLGPGAWSLDARFYGRKVIVVPDDGV